VERRRAGGTRNRVLLRFKCHFGGVGRRRARARERDRSVFVSVACHSRGQIQRRAFFVLQATMAGLEMLRRPVPVACWLSRFLVGGLVRGSRSLGYPEGLPVQDCRRIIRSIHPSIQPPVRSFVRPNPRPRIKEKKIEARPPKLQTQLLSTIWHQRVLFELESVHSFTRARKILPKETPPDNCHMHMITKG